VGGGGECTEKDARLETNKLSSTVNCIYVIISQYRPKDKQKKEENFCFVFPEHLLLCFLRFIINNVIDCIDSGKAT
jgi:hypothetical protein